MSCPCVVLLFLCCPLVLGVLVLLVLVVGTFVSSIPKDGHKRDFYRNGTGTTSDSEQAVQHSQKSNGLSSVGAISGANSNSILPGKIGVYGDCNIAILLYILFTAAKVIHIQHITWSFV